MVASHRYRRVLEEMPKHDTAKAVLLASGYPESTARTQTKRVMTGVAKYVAKEVLREHALDNKSSAQLMSDIVGISGIELMDRLRFIALEQDKDFSTALKILKALAKQHGVILEDEQAKVVVPVLNVGVRERETLVELNPSLLDGSIEPDNEDVGKELFCDPADSLDTPVEGGAQGEEA